MLIDMEPHIWPQQPLDLSILSVTRTRCCPLAISEEQGKLFKENKWNHYEEQGQKDRVDRVRERSRNSSKHLLGARYRVLG